MHSPFNDSGLPLGRLKDQWIKGAGMTVSARCAKNLFDFIRTLRIGMRAQGTPQHRRTDFMCLCGRLSAKVCNDVFGIFSDKDFLSRLEEGLDTLPLIGDEAGSGTGCFEDTRGGRESYIGHGVAMDVERHAR